MILVTGAAGFIGSHTTIALLARGERVVGVDNLNDYYDVSLKKARLNLFERDKNFTFYQVNIADKEAMEKLWAKHPEIDRIVHLAAQAGVRYSLKNPFSYIHSNVTGHLILLELARNREAIKHFVYASSSSVYGSNKKKPFSVLDRTDTPISLYGATKKCDELMSHSYAYLFDLPLTGLRFFTVYGPWGRPDMAAYIFTKLILEEKPIPVFNNGDMKRDYTFIDDIVMGVVSVLDYPPARINGNPPHALYNLGSHFSEPLMKFIDILQQALGKKAEIEFLPLQLGDVEETYVEASRNDFGFKPEVDIGEGIRRFVGWYREFHKI
jgi:UDP-glucuronate 4-epimerase